MNAEGGKATVINNLKAGTLIVPKVTVNGQNLKTDEDGAGMSLVFNFPNADRVEMPTEVTPEFGHVIAPAADLVIKGGNYSGCMVVNSAFANGEGHLFPYKGGKIIGDKTGFSAIKKVNGNTPKSSEQFYFKLDELKAGEWVNLQRERERN